jgi:hypothetical protein
VRSLGRARSAVGASAGNTARRFTRGSRASPSLGRLQRPCRAQLESGRVRRGGGRSALGEPRDRPAEACAQSGRRVCGREHGELQDSPGTVRRAGARARRSRNKPTSREPVADDWTALVRECLVARGKRVFPGTAQLVHAKAPLVLSGLSPEPGGEVVPAACVGGRRFRRDPSAETRAPSAELRLHQAVHAVTELAAERPALEQPQVGERRASGGRDCLDSALPPATEPIIAASAARLRCARCARAGSRAPSSRRSGSARGPCSSTCASSPCRHSPVGPRSRRSSCDPQW